MLDVAGGRLFTVAEEDDGGDIGSAGGREEQLLLNFHFCQAVFGRTEQSNPRAGRGHAAMVMITMMI